MGCGVSTENDLQERGGVALSEVAASAHMLEEMIAGACGRSSVGSTAPSLAYFSNASSKKKLRLMKQQQQQDSSSLGGSKHPISKQPQQKPARNPLSSAPERNPDDGGDEDFEEGDAEEEDVATIHQLEFAEDEEEESYPQVVGNSSSARNNIPLTVTTMSGQPNQQQSQPAPEEKDLSPGDGGGVASKQPPRGEHQQQPEPFFQRNNNNTNFNTLGNTLVLQHVPMKLPPNALLSNNQIEGSAESSTRDSSSGGSRRQQQIADLDRSHSNILRPTSNESGGSKQSTSDNSGGSQDVPNMFSVLPPSRKPSRPSVPLQHSSGARTTTPRAHNGAVQPTVHHVLSATIPAPPPLHFSRPVAESDPSAADRPNGSIFTDLFQRTEVADLAAAGRISYTTGSAPVSGAPRGDRNSPPIDPQRILVPMNGNNTSSATVVRKEDESASTSRKVQEAREGGNLVSSNNHIPPLPPLEAIPPTPEPHIPLVAGAIAFDSDREASALQMRRSKQKTIQAWMSECEPVRSIPPMGI